VENGHQRIETEIYQISPRIFRSFIQEITIMPMAIQLHLLRQQSRDAYDNTVSDGPWWFSILPTKTICFKTFGTTINGITKGQIFHPDHLDSYAVKDTSPDCKSNFAY
jgi:hypothetical protein